MGFPCIPHRHTAHLTRTTSAAVHAPHPHPYPTPPLAHHHPSPLSTALPSPGPRRRRPSAPSRSSAGWCRGAARSRSLHGRQAAAWQRQAQRQEHRFKFAYPGSVCQGGRRRAGPHSQRVMLGLEHCFSIAISCWMPSISSSLHGSRKDKQHNACPLHAQGWQLRLACRAFQNSPAQLTCPPDRSA